MVKSRQREIRANISNFLDAQFACAPMRFFKGMFSRFYACISPVLIEPEVGSRIDVNQHIFFGYIWNEISIGLGFK